MKQRDVYLYPEDCTFQEMRWKARNKVRCHNKNVYSPIWGSKNWNKGGWRYYSWLFHLSYPDNPLLSHPNGLYDK